MANDKFPINSDIDYLHTIYEDGVPVDLTTFDWYGIRWFYRSATGKKVAIAAYEVSDVKGGFTENLEDYDPANGQIISHIQRADMNIPEDVKIYWQPYAEVADVLHDTTFNGAGEEVFAGYSVDADTNA